MPFALILNWIDSLIKHRIRRAAATDFGHCRASSVPGYYFSFGKIGERKIRSQRPAHYLEDASEGLGATCNLIGRMSMYFIEDNVHGKLSHRENKKCLIVM